MIFILYAPVSYNPTDKQAVKQAVFDCSEEQINELMWGIGYAYVECGLAIKHACAEYFVGTSVKWSETERQVVVNQLVPDASCGCKKYQHVCGFVPKANKVNVVVSKFASVLDRSVASSPVESLMNLCKCFEGCGYTHDILRLARGRVLRRQPYLSVHSKFLDAVW